MIHASQMPNLSDLFLKKCMHIQTQKSVAEHTIHAPIKHSINLFVFLLGEICDKQLFYNE